MLYAAVEAGRIVFVEAALRTGWVVGIYLRIRWPLSRPALMGAGLVLSGAVVTLGMPLVVQLLVQRYLTELLSSSGVRE